MQLPILIAAADVIQASFIGPLDALTLDQIAADTLAALDTAEPKGNFVGIELGAAPADGAVSLVITGSQSDEGGLVWADVVLRFAVVPHNAAGLDAQLAVIATQQAAAAADVLYQTDFAVAGAAQTLVFVEVWAPGGGPA